MKNKLIICLVLITLFTTVGCSRIKSTVKKVEGKIESVVKKVPLMEFDKYKNIAIDKIKSIKKIRYTEAGSNEETITDKDEIKKIYNTLSKIKVGNEVTSACEDNTTIYEFNMSDNNKLNIEIECDWIVVGNKRYEIE